MTGIQSESTSLSTSSSSELPSSEPLSGSLQVVWSESVGDMEYESAGDSESKFAGDLGFDLAQDLEPEWQFFALGIIDATMWEEQMLIMWA